MCSTQLRELYCVDADTGREIFATQLPGVATSPALAGEVLVVADDSGSGGMVHGYSLDGQQLWSAELDAEDPPSAQVPDDDPLLAGDVVVWVQGTDSARELVAVDVASGRRQWQQPATDVRALYADGHQLYVATDQGALVALDASGAQLWQAQLDDVTGDGTVVGLTSVLDGADIAVIVDGQPARLVVIDSGGGSLRWDQDLDAVGAEGISVASDDDVWDISARGGGKRVRQDVNASDVAVVADHVLIAGATRLEAVPLLER